MSDEQGFIDIDPTPEKRPVLAAGKYGAEGEAKLEKLASATVRYGRDAGKPCINMRISVLTDAHGFVSFFRDWPLDGQAKNNTLRMLTQLGVDLAALPRGTDGKVRLDLTHLEGSKVIVELRYREYDMKDADGNPTGERGSSNDIVNVWLRK